MLLAILADIHANRQAYEACLAHAQAKGAQRIALLGDFVGYGGDPEAVLERTMALVAAGAVAVKGNHDAAVADERESMNDAALQAIAWTRAQLGAPHRAFLAALPMTVADEDRLFVHAEASAPASWSYVRDIDDAVRSLRGSAARITFCGHIHRPAVYSQSATGKVIRFTPIPGVPVPLLPHRRWVVVAGAVGQPRDGDPDACYVLLDTARSEVTYHRVAYDIDAAAEAIRRNGLPDWLAARLYEGL